MNNVQTFRLLKKTAKSEFHYLLRRTYSKKQELFAIVQMRRKGKDAKSLYDIKFM